MAFQEFRRTFIIENPGFFLDLSGFANLKRLASLKHRISDDDVRATMRALGLDPLSKKKVGQYSLGMRERLGNRTGNHGRSGAFDIGRAF